MSSSNGASRMLAFYGKGGIGKSTVASNLSVLFAQAGSRVLQVGCDPKRDSCYSLVDHSARRTAMEVMQRRGSITIDPAEVLVEGRFGVDCIEAGGPEPGVGCAGRGITITVDMLKRSGLLESTYDVVLFDVLGDVVCGGFAVPLRSGFAREVYVVLSGELMAMYAANNICKALARFQRTGARLAGIIPNLRSVPRELDTLRQLAERFGTQLLPGVARDTAIHEAEAASTPVVLHAPESEAARSLNDLFAAIATSDPNSWCVPRALDDDEFDTFVRGTSGGS